MNFAPDGGTTVIKAAILRLAERHRAEQHRLSAPKSRQLQPHRRRAGILGSLVQTSARALLYTATGLGLLAYWMTPDDQAALEQTLRDAGSGFRLEDDPRAAAPPETVFHDAPPETVSRDAPPEEFSSEDAPLGTSPRTAPPETAAGHAPLEENPGESAPLETVSGDALLLEENFREDALPEIKPRGDRE